MILFETDSRKIKPGQTFVCIKGLTVDGHDFVDSAIKLLKDLLKHQYQLK